MCTINVRGCDLKSPTQVALLAQWQRVSLIKYPTPRAPFFKDILYIITISPFADIPESFLVCLLLPCFLLSVQCC